MRYFVINIQNLAVEEVKDDSWFSNPIKKIGRKNALMCYFDDFGGYTAKYSWASKNIIMQSSSYGENNRLFLSKVGRFQVK